jgi:adenylate kinase family enzyme
MPSDLFAFTNKPPKFTPKRCIIFGIPGSGKSTFALRLSHLLNLPLFHLDKYFFTSGWQERNYEEFLAIQKKLIKKDSWIIDGNATRSLEIRYKEADLVIYFRFNRLLCLYRIFKRLITKNPRISDRAEGCQEKVRLRLVKYLFGFPKRVESHLKELKKKYPSTPFYEFVNDKQMEAFLSYLYTK